MEFNDRVLKCSDCGNDFIFTAGEQLFFFDRQFKNDPKRCKLCKAKRAGLGRTAEGSSASATLPLSRTETRTECSACGVDTTVPFKPTQGRPVFCRSCFQLKRVPAAVAKVAGLDEPALAVEQAIAESIASAGMDTMPLNPHALSPNDATGMERMATEAAQA
jgi:CxxC-x17-CxxC domain-containing protein